MNLTYESHQIMSSPRIGILLAIAIVFTYLASAFGEDSIPTKELQEVEVKGHG